MFVPTATTRPGGFIFRALIGALPVAPEITRHRLRCAAARDGLWCKSYWTCKRVVRFLACASHLFSMRTFIDGGGPACLVMRFLRHSALWLMSLVPMVVPDAALAVPAVSAEVAAPALLPEPTGPVVLSIGGALRLTNKDGQAHFDMAMLERLPQTSFQTQTPWYNQPRKFTGPLLRDVLAAVGANGQMIEARALNDYRVSIPVADTQRYDVIIARLIDDKPMPLRDKGPLFIIYPFDRHSELRSSLYYGRSAWQLRRLDLR